MHLNNFSFYSVSELLQPLTQVPAFILTATVDTLSSEWTKIILGTFFLAGAVYTGVDLYSRRIKNLQPEPVKAPIIADKEIIITNKKIIDHENNNPLKDIEFFPTTNIRNFDQLREGIGKYISLITTRYADRPLWQYEYSCHGFICNNIEHGLLTEISRPIKLENETYYEFRLKNNNGEEKQYVMSNFDLLLCNADPDLQHQIYSNRKKYYLSSQATQ